MPSPTKVLVYCKDDGELSLMSFVLTHRMLYAVRKAIAPDELICRLRRNQCESGHNEIRCCVFIHQGRSQKLVNESLRLLERIDLEYPDVAVLVLDMSSSLSGDVIADQVIKGLAPMCDVLEAIKNMVAHKRRRLIAA